MSNKKDKRKKLLQEYANQKEMKSLLQDYTTDNEYFLRKLKELVAKGAKVNAIYKIYEPSFIWGGYASRCRVRNAIPLISAVIRGSEEAIDFLIKKGANVNLRSSDQDMPALMYAVWYNYPKIAKKLINNGADVNATMSIASSVLEKDKKYCALRYAIMFDNKELENMLLNAGAVDTKECIEERLFKNACARADLNQERKDLLKKLAAQRPNFLKRLCDSFKVRGS